MKSDEGENENKQVYTIINKIKTILTLNDYQTSVDQISGDHNILGNIPFDIDLFERFATPTFWNHANSTRYAYALAETWNNLIDKERVDMNPLHTIDMNRFPKNELWPGGIKSPVFLNRFERLSTLFGFALLSFYLFYDLVAFDGQSIQFNFKLEDTIILYSLLMFSVPIMRSFLCRIRKPRHRLPDSGGEIKNTEK